MCAAHCKRSRLGTRHRARLRSLGDAPQAPGCSGSRGHSTSTARGSSLPCHGQGGGTRQPGPEIPLHPRGGGFPSASSCRRHRGTPSPSSSCLAGPRALRGGTFTSPQRISISSPISGANCLVLWRLTGSLGDGIRRAGSEPRQEVLLFPQGSCEKALPSPLPPSLLLPSSHLQGRCALSLRPPGAGEPRVAPEHPPAPRAAPRCSAALSAGFSPGFQLFGVSGPCAGEAWKWL